MIKVADKNRYFEQVLNDYPDAIIVDIKDDSLKYLSPLYPYGDIPVPFDSGNMKACCVEAVWEGLKVFEHMGLDTNVFEKYHHRTAKMYGKFIGFQRGVYGHDVLSVDEAYKNIYFRQYKWMLENHAMKFVDKLRQYDSENKCVVLLDDNINGDLKNLSLDNKISHAYLLQAYALGLPPYEDVFEIVERRGYRTNGRRDWDERIMIRCPKTIKPHNNDMPKQTEIDFGV